MRIQSNHLSNASLCFLLGNRQESSFRSRNLLVNTLSCNLHVKSLEQLNVVCRKRVFLAVLSMATNSSCSRSRLENRKNSRVSSTSNHLQHLVLSLSMSFGFGTRLTTTFVFTVFRRLFAMALSRIIFARWRVILMLSLASDETITVSSASC